MGVLNMADARIFPQYMDDPVPHGVLHVFLAGTDFGARVFADETFSKMRSNPVTADAAGTFPCIHLAPGLYRVVIETPRGQRVQYEQDNVPVRNFDPEKHPFTAPDIGTLLDRSLLSYEASSTLDTLVLPGDFIHVARGGYFYQVAPRDAQDHHVTTARGVKLYAQPISEACFTPRQFGARMDGVSDDGDALAACLSYAQKNGYSVDLGVGEYRVAGRDTPLLRYVRPEDPHNNRFALRGAGPSSSRLRITGDCAAPLFDIQGDTSDYSAPNPRASWFQFEGFSINCGGHAVDLFAFTCADRCNLKNVTAFDFRGYGVVGRQWWDSVCDARFVRGGDCLRLRYSDETAAFSAGQTITGAGGATAHVMWVDRNRACLEITNVTGTFAHGEAITGAQTGAAIADIPNGLEGSEKAVIDFDYEFAERKFDSACNNIIFPDTVQIESYRWRALHWGEATRQNKFAGKIHWWIDRRYGGPCIYMDGGNSNHFQPGMNITHDDANARAIVVDGRNYQATGNRFIGISGGQGITFIGDCRDNIIANSAFNNGPNACVILGGGKDNMIRDNMPRGSGPELQNDAASPDFALRDRVIPERVHIGDGVPAGGWSAARLNVYSPRQNLLVRFESGDPTAAFEIADNTPDNVYRISAAGQG